MLQNNNNKGNKGVQCIPKLLGTNFFAGPDSNSEIPVGIIDNSGQRNFVVA